MAGDAPAKAAGKGLGFLTRKVGPLPLFVWLGAGLGIYLYFERKQAATSSAAPNQQTDPAGNVGSIDPATGYVYGSPEDQAALASQDGGSSTGSAGATGGTGSQAYTDNNAWGVAAVNYLVGLGIDATTANQAIENYLSSQTLTTAQQGDVNLAIQALGPPPQLPGPVAGNPAPVTTPGGGGSGSGSGSGGSGGGHLTGGGNPPHVGKPIPAPGKKKSVPAPTGLVVSAKSSHSARVKWNRVTGATGYHLLCTDMATKAIKGQADAGASTLTYSFENLQASHSYVFDVWAQPESGAVGTGPHAEVSATLPRTG